MVAIGPVKEIIAAYRNLIETGGPQTLSPMVATG